MRSGGLLGRAKKEKDMREPLIYGIEEIRKLNESGQGAAEPHLSFVSNSKGCGSIIDISLMVPESVILFVSPPACARHITVYPWQRTGRVFFLEEEEKDIVTGAHLEAIEEAVREILACVKPAPRLLLIGASCIDRLMSSDIENLTRKLSGKYHVPMETVWMDPVIGNAHPQQKLWYKVFSMLEDSRDLARLDAVNMIGRLRPVHKDSEFYRILRNAGIKTVRHLAQCQTLEEFQEMGRARLNVAGVPFGIQAAKRMEARNGIPYMQAYPTFDPDVVHEMYQNLSRCLGVPLDDGEEYRYTKKQVEKLRNLLRGKSIAVGESYAGMVNSFQMAVDLCKIGLPVKYIFCDGSIGSKKEEINWLSRNSPETRVVIMSHPSMVQVIEKKPLKADLAIGTHEDWFYGCPDTKWITMEHVQHDTDYASINRFVSKVEECMGTGREGTDEEVI